VTTINVNTIAPSGSTLTVGDSGDTIVAPEVKVNTVKDAGGNTLWVSNGSGTLSSVSGFGGALNLLSTQTASNSASISFTSGIDSTYKEYVFKFINIHSVTDNVNFRFEGSTGSFGVTKTTTSFTAYHREDDGDTGLGYWAAGDLAQSTDPQILLSGLGNVNDECGSGVLHLFNPASTTYVKNFYSTVQQMDHGGLCINGYYGGYFNTTSAITGIRFAMSSGNIDAGTIKMYGVS